MKQPGLNVGLWFQLNEALWKIHRTVLDGEDVNSAVDFDPNKEMLPHAIELEVTGYFRFDSQKARLLPQTGQRVFHISQIILGRPLPQRSSE